MQWVLFGNKVCDITEFNHPGGNYIKSLIIGREVSRYVYGAYGPEEDLKI